MSDIELTLDYRHPDGDISITVSAAMDAPLELVKRGANALTAAIETPVFVKPTPAPSTATDYIGNRVPEFNADVLRHCQYAWQKYIHDTPTPWKMLSDVSPTLTALAHVVLAASPGTNARLDLQRVKRDIVGHSEFAHLVRETTATPQEGDAPTN